MQQLEPLAAQGAAAHQAEARHRGARWTYVRLVGGFQRELLLALFLCLCYSLFRQVPAWNENSRYDLVLAIVDDGTTQIDRYHENTGDKAFFRGHYYSDKAPGSSLLGVPVYATLRAISTLAGTGDPDPGTVMYALTVVICGLPTVLLALLLLRFLRPMVGEWWALAMSIGYGLGTIAFPFATMYFGHAPAAFFLFAAFYTLWRCGSGPSTWRPILAGFLAGWAVLTEFTAALGVVVLLCYALSYSRRALLLMIAGGIPVAIVLLIYNWVSFGGPFSLGYSNLGNSGFAEGMSHGLFGITTPKLTALNEILLAPRGLLRLSPWLALAPLGILRLQRRHERREIAVCIAIVVAFMLLNAAYFLPFGGATPGPRFLVPALPFATVLVALAPRVFRPLVGLQMAFSVVVVTIATSMGPIVFEGVLDPLSHRWAAQMNGRAMAETIAWRHWGFHGLEPLILLGVMGAVTLLGLLASTRRTPATRRLVVTLVGALAALVIGLHIPIDRPTIRGLTGSASANASTNNARIMIVDTGVTGVLLRDEERHAEPWAQMVNLGAPMEHARVTFTVHAPSGEGIWSAWHDDVDWRQGERKYLSVDWQLDDEAQGNYQISVAVTSADDETILAQVENAGTVLVLPNAEDKGEDEHEHEGEDGHEDEGEGEGEHEGEEEHEGEDEHDH